MHKVKDKQLPLWLCVSLKNRIVLPTKISRLTYLLEQGHLHKIIDTPVYLFLLEIYRIQRLFKTWPKKGCKLRIPSFLIPYWPVNSSVMFQPPFFLESLQPIGNLYYQGSISAVSAQLSLPWRASFLLNFLLPLIPWKQKNIC